MPFLAIFRVSIFYRTGFHIRQRGEGCPASNRGSSHGTQKPSRLGISKSDDVEAFADASVTENDDDSEDKDADVSIDTGNDASNDEDSEESYDSSDDDSSEDEYEEDFSDEESDEE